MEVGDPWEAGGSSASETGTLSERSANGVEARCCFLSEELHKRMQRFAVEKKAIMSRPPSESASAAKSRGSPADAEQGSRVVMPPLESFMRVADMSARRSWYLARAQPGDLVCGTVAAVTEAGLLVTLLCCDGDRVKLDIAGLRIMAFCAARDLPRYYSHESPLEAFTAKDKVRGIIIVVPSEGGKMQIAMHARALSGLGISGEFQAAKLGLISDDDLPLHYRRQRDTEGQGYNEMLVHLPAFHNPHGTAHISYSLGLSSGSAVGCSSGWQGEPDEETYSLLCNLSALKIAKSECAAALRKEQSHRMALKSVASGVRYFKEGKYTEAVQCFFKALNVDPENVEALVARGALFANNESYAKAIEDFEKALHHAPDHCNARSYLVQTLVAYGKEFEASSSDERAKDCFVKALQLDKQSVEAKRCLQHLESKAEKEVFTCAEPPPPPVVPMCRSDSRGLQSKSSSRSPSASRPSHSSPRHTALPHVILVGDSDSADSSFNQEGHHSRRMADSKSRRDSRAGDDRASQAERRAGEVGRKHSTNALNPLSADVQRLRKRPRRSRSGSSSSSSSSSSRKRHRHRHKKSKRRSRDAEQQLEDSRNMSRNRQSERRNSSERRSDGSSGAHMSCDGGSRVLKDSMQAEAVHQRSSTGGECRRGGAADRQGGKGTLHPSVPPGSDAAGTVVARPHESDKLPYKFDAHVGRAEPLKGGNEERQRRRHANGVLPLSCAVKHEEAAPNGARDEAGYGLAGSKSERETGAALRSFAVGGASRSAHPPQGVAQSVAGAADDPATARKRAAALMEMEAFLQELKQKKRQTSSKKGTQ